MILFAVCLRCHGQLHPEYCRDWNDDGHDELTAFECSRCGTRTELGCIRCTVVGADRRIA